MSGGGKARWIATGLFLLYSMIIVTASGISLPAAVIFPAAYCVFAQHVPFLWSLVAACIPLLLAVNPAFTMGAYLYGVVLVAALTMQHFLGKGRVGLAVGAPAAVISLMVTASVYSIAQENGTGITQVIEGWADAVVSESLRASTGMLPGAQQQEFQETLPVMRERIVRLFPSIVLTGAVFVMWLNALIVSFGRKGLRLKEWRSPEWLIGGFIVAAALTVLPVGRLSTLGLNALIVTGQVYFFQGLAIVSVFMVERNWPFLVRCPIYILILIQIYMMVIVAGLGLFDAWFDFRKRIRTPKGDRA